MQPEQGHCVPEEASRHDREGAGGHHATARLECRKNIVETDTCQGCKDWALTLTGIDPGVLK
jgi:hypothetical protein